MRMSSKSLVVRTTDCMVKVSNPLQGWSDGTHLLCKTFRKGLSGEQNIRTSCHGCGEVSCAVRTYPFSSLTSMTFMHSYLILSWLPVSGTHNTEMDLIQRTWIYQTGCLCIASSPLPMPALSKLFDRAIRPPSPHS